MDIHATKMLGAGLAVFGLLGVGIGVGNIFSSLINGIARNPSAKGDLFKAGYIGAALTEAIGLFAIVVAIFILYK
jgi:F-type H+-transporting ATPase subunit c